MILIHIKKENREPKVGEWYHEEGSNYVGKYDEIGLITSDCLALSLSVILDAPDNPKHLDKAIEYPISNSEEIFQWLCKNGKLTEEWVEWEWPISDMDNGTVMLHAPNRIKENPEESCPNLSCDETYTDWSQRLFNHMAQDHDIILTDTQLQDIYACIVKFDPEKETKRFLLK